MTCKAFRNRGVGKLLGEAYIDYATKLVCAYSNTFFNCRYNSAFKMGICIELYDEPR